MESYWTLSSTGKAHWLLEFTRIYRSFSPQSIEKREAAILDHQLPGIFLPLDEGDRLAGRFHYPPLVFTPQAAGDRGGFGYVFDPVRFRQLRSGLDAPSLDPMLDELEAFWLEEETIHQTRSAYPEWLSELLPSDNWTGEPGIGFPLYRMGGSHLDYARLLELGVPGMENRIRKLNQAAPNGSPLYGSMLNAIQALRKVLLFYERDARSKAEKSGDHVRINRFITLANALNNLQHRPPETFFEGVQLFYLYCLASGSNNFGRMDDFLAPLYEKESREGMLGDEEATEILMELWKLINYREIIYDGRVIIGGRGRKNERAADEVALLIMEATRRVADVLPQLTLRMYPAMDPRLKEKAFDLIAGGNPYPMLYNDQVNIPSAMDAFGVPEELAEDCIPFGCGEYVLYHKSFGTPSGVINLLKALEVTLHGGMDPVSGKRMGVPDANAITPDCFDHIWKAYTLNVEAYTDALALQEKIEYEVAARTAPFLFFSMLYDECLERGKAIFDGGILHLGGTLETYGNTNTADAFLAIKKLVFGEKSHSMEEILKTLDNNFGDNPLLHRRLLDQPKYGNDDEEADAMMVRVHDHACHAAIRAGREVGLDSYLVVNINNDANTTLGKFTAASADGRSAYSSMANGNTPTMGMDRNGATALLNSLVKPSTRIHAGATQNFKLSREMLERYRDQTVQMIDTYFDNGGAQLMITAVNKGDLEDAMVHPGKYPNLLVRVGGFSARFVELSREVQMEILERTLY